MLSRLRARIARLTNRQDEGFTLVELVISVAILGAVMTAIVAAMTVALKTNKETGDRLTSSRDLQFASTWFGDDVQGANTITEGGSPLCGSDPASSVVIQFVNYDITTIPATAPPTAAPYGLSSGETRKVTYVLRSRTDDGVTTNELHRLVCGTSSSDDIVAHSLATSPAPVVTTAATTASVQFVTADTGQPFTLTGTRRSS
jgi:prepilin-type N-terminal cleavage/methylation domain-containing protein